MITERQLEQANYHSSWAQGKTVDPMLVLRDRAISRQQGIEPIRLSRIKPTGKYTQTELELGEGFDIGVIYEIHPRQSTNIDGGWRDYLLHNHPRSYIAPTQDIVQLKPDDIVLKIDRHQTVVERKRLDESPEGFKRVTTVGNTKRVKTKPGSKPVQVFTQSDFFNLLPEQGTTDYSFDTPGHFYFPEERKQTTSRNDDRRRREQAERKRLADDFIYRVIAGS